MTKLDFSEEETENCVETSGDFGRKYGAFDGTILDAEIVKNKATGEDKRTDKNGSAFYCVKLNIKYNNDKKDKNITFIFNTYPKFVMGKPAKQLQEVLKFEALDMLDLSKFTNKKVPIIIGAQTAWQGESFEGNSVGEYEGVKFIRNSVIGFTKEWSDEDKSREDGIRERFKSHNSKSTSDPSQPGFEQNQVDVEKNNIEEDAW